MDLFGFVSKLKYILFKTQVVKVYIHKFYDFVDAKYDLLEIGSIVLSNSNNKFAIPKLLWHPLFFKTLKF